MKAAVISFTKRGSELNKIICGGLKGRGGAVQGYASGKYADGKDLQAFCNLGGLMGELFGTSDAILVIGACGIAVRAIAPYLKGKSEDPAVAVAGEDGKYVISLLSGHLGGANDFSRQVAALIGAEPVITTATDVNHKFAVDDWAVKHDLILADISMIKEISGAVLNGEKVGFYSSYPVEGNLPPELSGDIQDAGICISPDIALKPFARTLNLMPRNIVLGIGCKKDVAGEVIINAVTDTLRRFKLDKRRICRICSVDIKAGEKGILKLAEVLKAEYLTFTAEELKQVPGDFNGSEFVKKTVGVDNVCERSAMLGSGCGRKLIPKTALEGVTLSACEMDYAVSFHAAEGYLSGEAHKA